jgi:hypothetical protein
MTHEQNGFLKRHQIPAHLSWEEVSLILRAKPHALNIPAARKLFLRSKSTKHGESDRTWVKLKSAFHNRQKLMRIK